VTYEVADIRQNLPDGPFDNIIWDAAIEHFTEEEIGRIMREIHAPLCPHGVLSGYTIIEQGQRKMHDEHEYEFKSKEDLARFFSPHFHNVLILQTNYPTRQNLYFFASDSALSLDKDMVRIVASIGLRGGAGQKNQDQAPSLR